MSEHESGAHQDDAHNDATTRTDDVTTRARDDAGLAHGQARLAYTIIQSLLEHTRVTQDLVALMAQVLDEDTTKALTGTPYWAAYLDSRRAMERTRADIEKFAEVWTRMSEEESDAHTPTPTPSTQNSEG